MSVPMQIHVRNILRCPYDARNSPGITPVRRKKPVFVPHEKIIEIYHEIKATGRTPTRREIADITEMSEANVGKILKGAGL